jgi:hypothetical protein
MTHLNTRHGGAAKRHRARTADNKIHLLRSSHSFAMLRCSALAAAIAAPAKREVSWRAREPLGQMRFA